MFLALDGLPLAEVSNSNLSLTKGKLLLFVVILFVLDVRLHDVFLAFVMMDIRLQLCGVVPLQSLL